MKMLIQRVSQAQISIDNQITASISRGMVILIGIETSDTQHKTDHLVQKALNLRIFPDDRLPMNRSILDYQGELLLVPQFTLCADTSGRRPSFTNAMPPAQAKVLFDYLVRQFSQSPIVVKTGVFGAHMAVSLVNDGPVTILLEN